MLRARDVERRAAVDRPRAEVGRRAVERLRAEVDLRAAGRRAVVERRAVERPREAVERPLAVVRRAPERRAVPLRGVLAFLVVRRLDDPLRVAEPPLLRTAWLRLFRAFLMCVWNSRIAFFASPSTFEVADLIRFSNASSDVFRRFSAAFPAPPRAVDRRAAVVARRAVFVARRAVVVARRAVVERRAVVRREVDERPLAVRPVLLRAVVRRTPPDLPAVLRLAVLRAAGDISLLSLGGRWGCLFHTADANASRNLRKHVERKLPVEARRQLDVIQRDPFIRRVDQRGCLEKRHRSLRKETIRDAFRKCLAEPVTVGESR